MVTERERNPEDIASPSRLRRVSIASPSRLRRVSPLHKDAVHPATAKTRSPDCAGRPRRGLEMLSRASVNGSTTAVPVAAAVPGRITQLQAPSVPHDTCLGYYDVSGQYDKEFACNNTDHRFCCGSCFLRFCCADRGKRLEQKSCTNYNTPDWIKTQPPSPAPTGDTYDPELDQTNATVYITCGVVALVIAIGISAKVAYDKATKPPQEMNSYESSSTPPLDLVTSVDGVPKDTRLNIWGMVSTIHVEYFHLRLSSPAAYDLSLSRSFQNLSHLPPSYELALQPDLSKYSSSLHRLSRWSVALHPPIRPRRVQRAMSQDHVLSPPRTPRRGDYGLSSYGVMAAAAYGSSRHLSEEQLLSAERLHSQDPLLLSPAMRRDKFREKAMARAMSHADMLLPTTPVMDRHKMAKMHSQPSASNDSYNTLTVNHQVSTSKRQAFASRRTHTVDHLQYIPGHHHTYRTASKNEVTV
uniref:Shisa N-terminal domain-containing protein n=1 Tax=Scophthalmus maximus TaxID=52904 RepID=A0A8D3CW65_SCOMX